MHSRCFLARDKMLLKHVRARVHLESKSIYIDPLTLTITRPMSGIEYGSTFLWGVPTQWYYQTLHTR